MSKEGITDNKNKGNKGKLIVTLIILVLLIGGGIYYYLGLQQKKINAVFEQLKEQGVVFKEWKKNSDKTYSLVEPKLQVSATTQLNVESFDVALKDDGLLDLTLKNVSYKNEVVEVALPTITITGYKLNKDIFDPRLKNKMLPFALHLLSNDFKLMVFDNSLVKLSFNLNELKISASIAMDKYELHDYNNGIVAQQIIDKYNIVTNISTNSISLPPTRQVASIEHITVHDINVRLQVLMASIADDKPDQPFEKVSGAVVIKNYKIDTKSPLKHEEQMSIEEITTDGFSMRYGKKAPVDTINNLLAFAKSASISVSEAMEKGEKAELDYPKLFGLIRDALYMIDMVGPFQQEAKNAISIQNDSEVDITVNIEGLKIGYEPFKTSIEYKGLDINAASPLLDDQAVAVGKIGIVGIKSVDFSSLYQFAVSELDKLSKLDTIPNDTTYFVGLMANVGKLYPKIDGIEVKNVDVNLPMSKGNVKFDEISLNHKYAVSGPIPTSIDLNVVNYQQFVEDFTYFPQSVGLSDGMLKLSARIKADWNEEKKQILLHDSFLETNVFGRVDASATIGQVQPYLFSGNTIEMAAAASGLTVKDVEISLDDKGKLSAFREAIAKEKKISVEEVNYGLISRMVPIMQDYIDDDDIRAGVIVPVAKFMKNGGVIAFDAKSKTNFGVGIPGLAMMDLSNNLDPLWSLFDIAVTVK
ncbi:hypothetical protein [Bartonella sp. HY761]|uniref:hypothetical protein n=1 Tax=Bartonella sp. HY761 TaxID=2979330 RepID=UPI00220E6A51|nr:hypothetical protein [Bartonella sp. HY761]UXN05427.1 hypothetical protein N6A79_08910 [Bartonella sp. HY761]